MDSDVGFHYSETGTFRLASKKRENSQANQARFQLDEGPPRRASEVSAATIATAGADATVEAKEADEVDEGSERVAESEEDEQDATGGRRYP